MEFIMLFKGYLVQKTQLWQYFAMKLLFIFKFQIVPFVFAPNL